jgi:hypothetical protein
VRAEVPPPACAANTDCFRSSVVPWQAGHWGVSVARTRASNCLSHVLQAYSYKGIAEVSVIAGLGLILSDRASIVAIKRARSPIYW